MRFDTTVSTLKALRQELEAGGWAVDGRDYLTSFRLDTRANGKGPQEWDALKARYVRALESVQGKEGIGPPPGQNHPSKNSATSILSLIPRLPSLGLSSSFNLGKADVYPSTSGKAPAVSRLMRRLHAHPKECVVLFDDDNDLGMAELCAPGRRIAVSITHDSVRRVRG